MASRESRNGGKMCWWLRPDLAEEFGVNVSTPVPPHPKPAIEDAPKMVAADTSASTVTTRPTEVRSPERRGWARGAARGKSRLVSHQLSVPALVTFCPAGPRLYQLDFHPSPVVRSISGVASLGCRCSTQRSARCSSPFSPAPTPPRPRWGQRTPQALPMRLPALPATEGRTTARPSRHYLRARRHPCSCRARC